MSAVGRWTLIASASGPTAAGDGSEVRALGCGDGSDRAGVSSGSSEQPPATTDKATSAAAMRVPTALTVRALTLPGHAPI